MEFKQKLRGTIIEIDPSKIYKLVTTNYAANGHDGYTCFTDSSVKHEHNKEDLASAIDIIKKYLR